MIRSSVLELTVAVLVLSSGFPAHADSKPPVVVRVASDSGNDVKVTTQQDNPPMHRKVFVVPFEPGQVGIDSVQITEDGFTAGWLLLYKDPGATAPDPGKLVVWRDGRVVRSFATGRVFWSWSFQDVGRQVAYHVGPTHGETTSHCELHDVKTGRLLASWDGDLQNPDRPEWTKRLNH